MHVLVGGGQVAVHLAQPEIRLPGGGKAVGGASGALSFAPDDDVGETT